MPAASFILYGLCVLIGLSFLTHIFLTIPERKKRHDAVLDEGWFRVETTKRQRIGYTLSHITLVILLLYFASLIIRSGLNIPNRSTKVTVFFALFVFPYFRISYLLLRRLWYISTHVIFWNQHGIFVESKYSFNGKPQKWRDLCKYRMALIGFAMFAQTPKRTLVFRKKPRIIIYTFMRGGQHLEDHIHNVLIENGIISEELRPKRAPLRPPQRKPAI